MAVTGGPAWLIVTSLMFCAQTVGKPPIALDPTASPAVVDTPLRKRRRETPPRSFLMLRFGMTVPFVVGSGGLLELGAARHQRLAARPKLLHAYGQIGGGQHDAAHPRDGGELVQHAGDRGIGPDEDAHAGR